MPAPKITTAAVIGSNIYLPSDPKDLDSETVKFTRGQKAKVMLREAKRIIAEDEANPAIAQPRLMIIGDDSED